MNQVQVFVFGLMDLRGIEDSGQPWFVAVDVYKTLGLRQHGGVLNPLDHHEKDLESANLCRPTSRPGMLANQRIRPLQTHHAQRQTRS
jgi:prophage antirepressor-like protein